MNAAALDMKTAFIDSLKKKAINHIIIWRLIFCSFESENTLSCGEWSETSSITVCAGMREMELETNERKTRPRSLLIEFVERKINGQTLEDARTMMTNGALRCSKLINYLPGPL